MSNHLLRFQGVIPGCTVDASRVSPGQMFVMEFMLAQALIFTAFGVGLDPRQGRVFGPALAPFLVGGTLGLATLASTLAKPGYTGVCMGYPVHASIRMRPTSEALANPRQLSTRHAVLA
jgi:glycerol uptake facilitator-like aquaporin